VRKALDLTQQEFADQIGSKRNTIATYEMGRTDPSAAVVSLVCTKFNVNESWLRTGEGEMFMPLPKNEALAAQIQSFLQGGTDSFRERLVSLLLRLSPEQWDALEGYLLELVAPRAPALDIDAEVAAYRAELEAQRNSQEEDSVESTVSTGSSASGKRLA